MNKRNIQVNITDISSFQNGLNYPFRLNALRAKLWKVFIKCKNIMFSNFWSLFLKKYVLRLWDFFPAKCLSNQLKKWSFPLKIFFWKCEQIRSFLRISSHLLKKSLMENFIFWAVQSTQFFSGKVKKCLSNIINPN